ncbi:unnamed protein product [marine sediment metagenome]|uniref:Uncharacterized protein n=1 Tax=marine sediment metagenome TaxID=412755 RepID=X1TSC1_9ZZZZ
MSKKKGEKKRKGKYFNNFNMDSVRERLREMLKPRVDETPDDTGSTGTQSDLINKTDESIFENYLGGKWQEGYPREAP